MLVEVIWGEKTDHRKGYFERSSIALNKAITINYDHPVLLVVRICVLLNHITFHTKSLSSIHSHIYKVVQPLLHAEQTPIQGVIKARIPVRKGR